MSQNIIDLLQTSLDYGTGDTEYFKEFLDSCLEHGAFYSKDHSEVIIKTINTNLNSSFEKEKGLLLLLAFLPQTTVEAFSNNAVPWMVHCNKFVHQKEEVVDGLGLRVLTKLIKLSIKFPDVSKETAKQIVPKFLLDHVRRRTDSKVSQELLECVQACMTEYPGPSGEFRLDLLRLLLITVEGRPEVVQAAAKCIPLVARVGGGGKQGVSHKTAWLRLQLALVAQLHTLLNKLYEHVDCQQVKESTSSDDPSLTLEPVVERNILCKTQRLATQFASVAHFLRAMLLGEFPVAKSVAPDAILDVVAHTQMPTHKALGTSMEALAIVSVLPSLQIAALRLLESLVLCLGRNLVPQGAMVCYLCSQVIVWTHQQHQDWPYAMDKPYSETRLAGYCCLYSWLSVAGVASPVEVLVDKSLPILLSDIYTKEPTVRLAVGSRSGKGKKKQQMLVNLEDRSEKLGDAFANRRLCERALLTLRLLVRVAVPFLKSEIHSNVVSTVLKLATELPVPYSDFNCRIALYQLLLTLCLEYHPSVAPPLAAALTVFSTGLHHPSPQVKSTCEMGLSSLEKLIHPTAATLYFPVSREKQQPLFMEQEGDGDASEGESVNPESKRRKVDIAEDSSSVISLVLSDGSDKSVVSATEERFTRKDDFNMDGSDDSVGFIEIVSIKKNPPSTEKDKELLPKFLRHENVPAGKEDSQNDSEINIVINEPALNDNEDKSQKDMNYNQEQPTSVKNEVEIIDESDVALANQEQPTRGKNEEKIQDESEAALANGQATNITNEFVQKADDIEVSQMLLDFKDEVNNGDGT